MLRQQRRQKYEGRDAKLCHPVLSLIEECHNLKWRAKDFDKSGLQAPLSNLGNGCHYHPHGRSFVHMLS
jgi:hypothetical protein